MNNSQNQRNESIIAKTNNVSSNQSIPGDRHDVALHHTCDDEGTQPTTFKPGNPPTCITIITDCYDDNAKSRQIVRATTLFPCTQISFVAINSTIQAAGNIIDTLDALHGKPGIILTNVAPRHGESKRWANGTPFAYTWVEGTLVVGTIDGHIFSLLKKFQLIDEIHLTGIAEVVSIFTKEGIIEKREEQEIIDTQFRSFNYMPRLAYYIWNHGDVPNIKHPIFNIPDIPAAIWWIDNFGNVKTTLVKEDIGLGEHETDEKRQVTIAIQGVKETKLPFYRRLKDVPNGEKAIIEGSSGYQDKRFLEIVVQGKGSAGGK